MQQISVKEVARKLAENKSFVLLDVREPDELKLAHLDNPHVFLAPVSRIARFGLDALPPEARDPAQEIVVFCHVGSRSQQIALWLSRQGWKNVASMEGGLNAYAMQVDPSVGRY